METEDFKIEWSGPMYPDYFQGAGACFTKWDAVAVGSASTIADAYADAVDFVYQGLDLPRVELPDFKDSGLPDETVPEAFEESLFFVSVYYMTKKEGA